MYERVKRAADYIRNICGEAETALVLGSGLSDTIKLENEITIPYTSIPDFPVSTTAGHKSEWACGMLSGKKVFVMRGRFHYYEGYSGEDIALPIRVMKLLGVKKLIVTNTCGGIADELTGGDIMLINDQINLSGVNILRGDNDERFGTRFPDMTEAYNKEMRDIAHECADKLGIKLFDGVYMGVAGPTYETPAEIRMYKLLGADAVAMSTVHDVVAAVHCGIKVVGFSLITNKAAGITGKKLSHSEVTRLAKSRAAKFAELLSMVAEKI